MHIYKNQWQTTGNPDGGKMQRVIYLFLFGAWLCVITGLTPAGAENRALLIGVGEYQNPDANLPGIDKDIRMMQEAVGLMGFESSQVKVVQDSEATLRGIEQAIEDWLISGVTGNDRVLFYFSGHGAQIYDKSGDEKDEVDEVLVAHDVKAERGTLKNVFLDDKFGELLSRVTAEEIFVFIDACHSGSATKSIDFITGEVPKFFHYKGMPAMTKGNFAVEQVSDKGNYIAISACRDDEKALATNKGSLFTQAILNTVKGKNRLTVNQLKDRATAYIRENVSNRKKVHHPQISGNKSLATKNIILASATSNPQNIWAKLEYLTVKADYSVNIQSNQKHFKVGEFLVLTCNIEQNGYLNVLNVSPGDKKVTVLYPNKYHRKNRVTAGDEISIPASGDRFRLRCTAPLGKSLIVVLQTKEKLNGYEEGKGGINALFKTLSGKTFRGFEAVGVNDDQGTLGAGKIITHVVE